MPQPTANDRPITPQQQRSIDTFIEESKTGESLHSDNAFFPMMLCAGYYANRQYDLADAALERAGHCHRSAKGIALRQALAHSNALLRAQSTTLIGTLFAIAVIAIAESHPGEKPIH